MSDLSVKMDGQSQTPSRNWQKWLWLIPAIVIVGVCVGALVVGIQASNRQAHNAVANVVTQSFHDKAIAQANLSKTSIEQQLKDAKATASKAVSDLESANAKASEAEAQQSAEMSSRQAAEALVAQRDGTVATLQQQLESLTAANTQLTADLATANQSVATEVQRAEAALATVTEQEATISSLEARIASLETNVVELTVSTPQAPSQRSAFPHEEETKTE